MNWKKILKKLEDHKKWNEAIAFMNYIIAKSPSKDMYLSVLYLLMNLLVEEDYEENKHDYYALLCRKYFQESYAQFSEDSEYLYYGGRIMSICPWYFNIEDIEFASKMVEQAIEREPYHIIYRQEYYWEISQHNSFDIHLQTYIKLVLDPKSVIQKELQSKGSLGEYILGMMIYWAEEINKKIDQQI